MTIFGGETRPDGRPRWPAPEGTVDKRRVKARIDTWIGTSLGAKHFEASVEVEQQQWWDEDAGDWRTPWNTPYDFHGKVYALDRKDAEEALNFMIQMATKCDLESYIIDRGFFSDDEDEEE